ncbi:MAG: RNA polymerase sigma factor [Opitutales bacterium]
MDSTPSAHPPDAATAWYRSVANDHGAALLRYARSLTGGDEDAARDAVQETFLRLLKADRATVADHVLPWLFRVCRSRVIDSRRKTARVVALEPEAVEREPDADAPPAETTETRDSLRQARALIDRLPERDREVLRLKFEHEFSYQEIADVLDLTAGNVGYILSTTLKTLRQDMARSL